MLNPVALRLPVTARVAYTALMLQCWLEINEAVSLVSSKSSSGELRSNILLRSVALRVEQQLGR